MALNEKQQRFVREYLLDLNATQAAIRAGYSAKTAEQMGYKLVQKSLVQEALRKAIDERAKRTEVTQDRVIEEIWKVAAAAASDCTDSELKVSNKLRALELLGKHLGLFEGKSGPAASAENNLLEAIAARAGEDLNTDDLPEIE